MISRVKKFVSEKFINNHQMIPFAPIDVRKDMNDPRLFNYVGNRPILLNAKTIYGRCFQNIKLQEESNPLMRGLINSRTEQGERMKMVIRETIEVYYQTYQPESAFERFQLSKMDAPKLQKIPPWSIPMPWSPGSIEWERRSIKRWLERDYSEFDINLDISDGFTFFGPISSEKLQIEAERLYQVYTSIKNNGYNRLDRKDGDIEATILISKQGDWRWTAQSGQHRSIALAALGYEYIPIRVKGIVYESEVDYWPNVYSGLYTNKGALKMFRNLFEGMDF